MQSFSPFCTSSRKNIEKRDQNVLVQPTLPVVCTLCLCDEVPLHHFGLYRFVCIVLIKRLVQRTFSVKLFLTRLCLNNLL